MMAISKEDSGANPFPTAEKKLTIEGLLLLCTVVSYLEGDKFLKKMVQFALNMLYYVHQSE